MKIFEFNSKTGKSYINSDEISSFQQSDKLDRGNSIIIETSGNITFVDESIADIISLFDKPVYAVFEGDLIQKTVDSFKEYTEVKE